MTGPRHPSAAILLLRTLPLFLLLGFGVPRGVRADVERDLEPPPPWVFYPDPDPRTADEISTLLENSYDDLNKVVVARDLFVHRYGLWSVQKHYLVLKREANESRTWNAELTVSALRDTLGNAPQLWPVLEPLVDLADHSAEPYRRAFAALAIGSFHGPSFIPPPPRRKDPLIVRQPETMARRQIDRGIQVLGRLIRDGNKAVEVAAALALAKSGAPDARALLRATDRLSPSPTDQNITSVEGRMATLVAIGLLPNDRDDALFVQQLHDVDRRIRAAAALAVALQALAEPKPAWVESPERVLRALEGADIRMQLEDGAEATFARGTLALRSQARGEWRALFDLATTPSTKAATKEAAIQCLLFCPEPWLLDQVVESIRKVDDDVVIAGFLLLLGSAAMPQGIAACEDYLSKQGKPPKAKEDWDVRFYACLGLLRALASGQITDLDLRRRIFEALEQGASRGLARGPFRDELKDLLEGARRGILESPSYVVDERRVQALADTFVDVPGLLAHDLKDVVVVRLNALLLDMFNVNNVRPGEPGNRDKSEIPRRFFKEYHQRYPYFSRLDLLADRGRRPWPEMPPGGDPKREVRRK